MANNIYNVIKEFDNYSDQIYLTRVLDSLKLSRYCHSVLFDLNGNRFIYFNISTSNILDCTPGEYVYEGFQHFRRITHPHDFAYLVKKIIAIMINADEPKRNLILSRTDGQLLRLKNGNGNWLSKKVFLIYLNDSRNNNKLLIGVLDKFVYNSNNDKLNVTDREKEIFNLLSSGYSAKMIANELSISENTVITHRKNLINKLHVKNSAELIKKGVEINLHC